MELIMKNIFKKILILSLVTLLQGCQNKDGFYAKSVVGGVGVAPNSNIIPTPGSNPNPTPIGPTFCDQGSTPNVICNPLGGGKTPPAPSSHSGLIAFLYEGQNGWNTMDQYFTNGYKHPETIYFSNFNVPPRSFDEGFGVGSDFLRNIHGDKLIEWFAIHAKGNIVLPANKSPGAYHIVTLSDDGVRISVDGHDIINNPTTHAPTINCARDLVQLNRGDEKPFELGYFQGPRYFIAIVVLVKKIEQPGTFTNGAICFGGDTSGLIADGYEVMDPAWFTLPAGY
jgi:hypothetical protein